MVIEANLIIDSLWLGSYKAAQDINFLKKNKITVIINISKNIPVLHKSEFFVRLPINDDLQKSSIIMLYNHLSFITDYINQQLLLGKKILIHCYAGIQRSATIVAAYLMLFKKIKKYEEAICYIKKKRTIAFKSGINFKPALKQWQYDIYRKN